MSETSETMGRCFSEVYERRGSPCELKIADAIDRLAADVAAIKAKTSDIEWEAVQHFVESEKAWVKLVEEQRDAAIRERDEWREEARLAVINRDEARAEAQRIQDEADDQEQTEKVKRLNAAIDKIHYTLMNRTWERDEARAEVERLRAELAARPAANSPEIPDSSPADPPPAAPAAGWLTQEERGALSRAFDLLCDDDGDNPLAGTVQALLARAGSPPVVEVPVMVFGGGSYQMEKRYRAAMDRAGVQWKEVPRE